MAEREGRGAQTKEAVLCRKLEELESELRLLKNTPELHVDSFRSKLSFLKFLHSAEAAADDADCLSHIAARISALDAAYATAFDAAFTDDSPDKSSIENAKPAVTMRLAVLCKNLEELESMLNSIPLDPAAGNIRRKIDFTNFLLATEARRCGESEQLSLLATRLASVEAALIDAMPSSCSCTSSCLTGEAEEKDVVAPGLATLKRKMEELEKDINVDGLSDALRKIAFVRSLLAAEMEGSGGDKAEEFEGIMKRLSNMELEFEERNWFPADGGEGGFGGGSESSPCSCTSFCFDGGEEKGGNKGEDDNSASSGGSETVDVTSLVIQEEVVADCKSETAVSLEGSLKLVGEGKGGDGRRRILRVRSVGALVGVFAVAAATAAVVGSFFGAGEAIYLVPT